MSTVVDIAKAVKRQLNEAALSMPVRTAVEFRPVYDLKTMRDLKVSVVPRSKTDQMAARGSAQIEPQVDIGIMRKIAGDEDIERLLDLVEEIGDVFGMGDRLTHHTAAICTARSNDPVYDPEHLERFRQFTSVLTLSFRIL